MKKFSIVVMFLVMFNLNAFSEEQNTLLPSYQGVWNCLYISADKGVTIVEGNNMYYATVYASTIRTMDGDILKIKEIKEVQNKGKLFTILIFEGADEGYVWVLSRLEYDLILLQQMKDFNETLRVIFTVTK